MPAHKSDARAGAPAATFFGLPRPAALSACAADDAEDQPRDDRSGNAACYPVSAADGVQQPLARQVISMTQSIGKDRVAAAQRVSR
jgi:hypothetical protein